jgi:hypothetical protein
MHHLPLIAKKKQKEWNIIQHIATKNNFPQNLLQILKQQILHKDHPQKLMTIIKRGQPSHITVHKYAKLLTYSKTPT